MKKKKGKVYVTSHKWKRGKNKTHPGYYRKKRKKSGKKVISKTVTRGKVIRDPKTGFILGYAK